MTKFSEMSDQEMESWIRNRPGICRPPGSRWYVHDIEAALALPIRNPYVGYSINFCPTFMAIVELYPALEEQRAIETKGEANKLARWICEAWALMMEADND